MWRRTHFVRRPATTKSHLESVRRRTTAQTQSEASSLSTETGRTSNNRDCGEGVEFPGHMCATDCRLEIRDRFYCHTAVTALLGEDDIAGLN